MLKVRLIPMNITPVILEYDKARSNLILRCYVIYLQQSTISVIFSIYVLGSVRSVCVGQSAKRSSFRSEFSLITITRAPTEH